MIRALTVAEMAASRYVAQLAIEKRSGGSVLGKTEREVRVRGDESYDAGNQNVSATPSWQLTLRLASVSLAV